MNQTKHYNLNLPSGEDYYNIEHHNENMQTLDAALEARINVGVYVGDEEESRVIPLPRKPKFVLLMREGSRMNTVNARFGGLALDGYAAYAGSHVYLEIVDEGFRITHHPSNYSQAGDSADTNSYNVKYYYLWG